MKITELIEKLQQIVKERGDMEVFVLRAEYDKDFEPLELNDVGVNLQEAEFRTDSETKEDRLEIV